MVKQSSFCVILYQLDELLIILRLSQISENVIFKVNMTLIYNFCLKNLHCSFIDFRRQYEHFGLAFDMVSAQCSSLTVSWESSHPNPPSPAHSSYTNLTFPWLLQAPCRIPHLVYCILCLEYPWSPLCIPHTFLNSCSSIKNLSNVISHVKAFPNLSCRITTVLLWVWI